MLDAAKVLEAEGRKDVLIDVFGDYRGQPQEFQDDFVSALADVGRNVCFRGPYEQNQVDRLMGSVHAIVVPSIWWENSPVVIQEAFRNRRPVICSNIGGMAEKVRDGVDGLHFPVGNGLALALLLQRVAGERETLLALAQSIKTPSNRDSLLGQHIDLYQRLVAGPS